MDKQQKIILFSGIGVVAVLIALLVWMLVFKDNTGTTTSEEQQDALLQQQKDSLQLLLDQQAFAMQMDRLNIDSLPLDVNGINLQPEQTEIVNKYNEARNKIETLVAELKAEQQKSLQSSKRSQSEIDAHKKKIAELESQVTQLKNYCKDLLGQLAELNAKYEEQVQINTQLTEKNKELEETVHTTTTRNQELTDKVNTAKRLVVTGVSLRAYNKKNKVEKKVQKATKLSVDFTVTANNAAAPGMKTFYITIKSPEGQLLTGGGSFNAEGTTLQATASRQVEYANEEVSTSVTWGVNTTLTAGQYIVKIFCDGSCLTTRHFELK